MSDYLLKRLWEQQNGVPPVLPAGIKTSLVENEGVSTDNEEDYVFDSVRSFRDMHRGRQHHVTIETDSKPDSPADSIPKGKSDFEKQLGTLMGVYIPCFTNIVGVIVFVRLPWIVGEAGIGQALLIGLMSMACTFLTALSVCAIATNGRVSAGGPYYMISRSLGKEFGGAVGILFYIANIVGCVMYIIGVVEILTSYVAPVMSLGSPFTDNRVYGTILLCFVGSISAFGIQLIARASMLFFFAVSISLLSAFVGLLASNRPGLPELS